MNYREWLVCECGDSYEVSFPIKLLIINKKLTDIALATYELDYALHHTECVLKRFKESLEKDRQGIREAKND